MAKVKGQAANIAFNKIREKIERYELSPLDAVSEVELAKEFGMSRTPVREAMHRLISIGLLEQNGNRVVVTAIRMIDIKEILQVREAFEIASAKIIVNNGGFTPEENLFFEDLSKKLEDSINKLEYNNIFKLNNEFHRHITKFSKSARLYDMNNLLLIQTERLCWLTLITHRDNDNTIEAHKAIIDSINECNLEKATKNISDHLQVSLENYERILKDNNWENILKTISHL